ncbi:hypothetical protein [Bacillus sp. USDA818B3_A]|uniref:hypothetical protein n=1 Tax=Bacillus sp. USDA818B3_A TaxID=2698834 RepID=UPI001F4578C1|nr:hypothetical protein [Bacillus sp. USDA818B3_A]
MTNIMTEFQKKNDRSNPDSAMEALQFVPGMWVDGKYFWLKNTMEEVIYEESLLIKVKQEQLHSKISLSSVLVSNHSDQSKQITILAMHHFRDNEPDHLTFGSPVDNHIFHHANKMIYLVNGRCSKACMKEYTTVPLWNAYTDRIWASIEKGNLKYQPMAKGPAASILTMSMSIEPHQTAEMDTWIISGTNKNELFSIEKALLKKHTSISF